MGLYLTNCDQPALLPLFAKTPGRLAEPGTYKATIAVAKAAARADGYAKDFYSYAKSIGIKKVKLTLWLDQGFRPKKYQIVAGGANVQSAKWVVTFAGWKTTPISVPAKDSIRS